MRRRRGKEKRIECEKRVEKEKFFFFFGSLKIDTLSTAYTIFISGLFLICRKKKKK